MYFYDSPAPKPTLEKPGKQLREEKAAAPTASTGPRLPFSVISGAPRPGQDKPVSYRMADDLSQQQYVVGAGNGSGLCARLHCVCALLAPLLCAEQHDLLDLGACARV